MQVDFTQNHFALFDLPVDFDVDQEQLSTQYRELQRATHPDKYANASDQERRIAVQRAAQVNEAFNTLKKPLNRARYLLALHGHEINDETDTTVDPMFLMEQMELREQLDAVRSSDDPQAELDKISKSLRQRYKLLIDAIREHLHQHSDEGFKAARDSVLKLQFIDKLQQQINALEEELLDLY